jgi:hypothetical protein
VYAFRARDVAGRFDTTRVWRRPRRGTVGHGRYVVTAGETNLGMSCRSRAGRPDATQRSGCQHEPTVVVQEEFARGAARAACYAPRVKRAAGANVWSRPRSLLLSASLRSGPVRRPHADPADML